MNAASQGGAIGRAGLTPPQRNAIETLKGGVGKTEITAHMAAEDTRQGLRVLVVELDPQGSFTARTFGVDSDTAPRTVGDAIRDAVDGKDPAKAARNSLLRMDDPRLPLDPEKRQVWGKLDVLPCNQACTGLDMPASRWHVLNDVITAIEGDYDRIWFDFSPSITTLALAGRYAARRFIGITEAARGSVRAIEKWHATLGKIDEHHPAELVKTCRVVINKYLERETEQAHRALELQQEIGLATHGGLLLSPTLPRKAVVMQAEGAEKPLWAYNSTEARRMSDLYITPLHKNITKEPS